MQDAGDVLPRRLLCAHHRRSGKLRRFSKAAVHGCSGNRLRWVVFRETVPRIATPNSGRELSVASSSLICDWGGNQNDKQPGLFVAEQRATFAGLRSS
jgi:hypothetical protein